MNQTIYECGMTRRERIRKADSELAHARAIANSWQSPTGFSHYMTSCEYWIALRYAEWLYDEAGLSVAASKVRRLRDSRDVPKAWETFDQ
jgi:hypothetical protein